MDYDIKEKENLFCTAFLLISWALGFFLFFGIGKVDSFLLIHQANSPLMDLFFKYITYLGDGLFCLVIFTFLLTRKYRFALDFLIIFLLTGLLVQIGKRLVFAEELRPLGLLGKELIHAIPGVNLHERNSFPSGHTATGMACFLFLSIIQSGMLKKIILVLLGLLVGYSRIYLGQHFLSDVLAGIFIAMIVVYGWTFITSKFNWSNNLEGRLRLFRNSP